MEHSIKAVYFVVYKMHGVNGLENAGNVDLVTLGQPRPEIGLAVGFSETSSFTAAFRKITGVTPTAYHRSLA